MDDRTELAAFIEARMRADRVPGLSVAVVQGDEVRWRRGFGVADLSDGTPIEPHTPFLWFSMTKVVTATAIMQLVEDGLIGLDEPVQRYYPAFAVVRQPTPVTVRHLLSHSSGLANPIPLRWVHPADRAAPDHAAFVERLLARHARLRFTPGERARYSNLGYLVLGEVIGQVAGRPYEDQVRQRILGPLGMSHTGFEHGLGAVPAAVGYQRLPAPLTPLLRAALPPGIVGRRHGAYVAYRPFTVTGRAYGGLIGGVDDAARFALAHLEGLHSGQSILSSRSIEEMQRIRARGGPIDFGLAWFRRRGSGPGATHVEHLGGGSGYFNVLRLYPDRRLGIVLMGNTTRYDHEWLLAGIAAAF